MKNEKMLKIQIPHNIIIFIAGSVLGAIAENVISGFVSPIQTLTLFIIFMCLVFISFMLYHIAKQTKELSNNVGLRIKYFDRDRHGRGVLYSEARKVIEKADQNIFVLNSVITEISEYEKDDEKDDTVILERDKYYETLLERASKGITYERVIQLKNGQSVSSSIKDKDYINHFHRIFDIKEKNRNLSIGLIKAPAKRLSTFVLVDNESLIWQINEVLETGNVRMHGIFIIQDPRHEITQHFSVFAESAKREGFGAVHRNELPPI